MSQKIQIIPPRQQSLDFVHCDIWKQLPAADQQTCRQLLCQCIKELVLNEREQEHEPRKD